ncbi:hypothetical protein GCM10023189_47730 [Nibrella saemangeumensis]|uniref:YD repeat-containing protein n=1 Tax=Nibrella saemangeumensis TaxID=1084526 RepID=A0ABP8NER4_9BACT
MLSFFACEPKKVAAPPVCDLVGATEQLDQSGRLSTLVERSFTYTGGQLTSVFERNTDRLAGFRLEYNGNRLSRVTDTQNQLTIAFEYALTQASDKPYRATYTRNNQLQTVYSLEYLPTGKLSRLVENRQVVPSTSNIIERTFTFTYDANGNITLERAQDKLRNGSVTTTETEYTQDAQPSPFATVPQPIVLTLVALTQGAETLPGRFWTSGTIMGYTTYSVAANNTRTRRETTTFTSTRDEFKKLTAQEQTSLSYLTSQTNPTTRKTQHTYVYKCQQ